MRKVPRASELAVYSGASKLTTTWLIQQTRPGLAARQTKSSTDSFHALHSCAEARALVSSGFHPPPDPDRRHRCGAPLSRQGRAGLRGLARVRDDAAARQRPVALVRHPTGGEQRAGAYLVLEFAE